MFIKPRFSLVNVFVDVIKATMNSEEARELKQKYPQMKVERLRKGRSSRRVDQLPGAVRAIRATE